MNIENIIKSRHNSGEALSEKVTIMWCARFLDWKHPELVVQLAHRLKTDGYKVQIDMYGTGVELRSVKALSQDLSVQDMISFKGNVSNDEILKSMRKHDIL